MQSLINLIFLNIFTNNPHKKMFIQKKKWNITVTDIKKRNIK